MIIYLEGDHIKTGDLKDMTAENRAKKQIFESIIDVSSQIDQSGDCFPLKGEMTDVFRLDMRNCEYGFYLAKLRMTFSASQHAKVLVRTKLYINPRKNI